MLGHGYLTKTGSICRYHETTIFICYKVTTLYRSKLNLECLSWADPDSAGEGVLFGWYLRAMRLFHTYRHESCAIEIIWDELWLICEKRHFRKQPRTLVNQVSCRSSSDWGPADILRPKQCDFSKECHQWPSSCRMTTIASVMSFFCKHDSVSIK